MNCGAALALAMAAAVPAQARPQVQNSAAELLRAKLEAAEATIERLEARLTMVEQRLPTDTAAAAPPSEAMARSAPAEPPVGDADPAVLPREARGTWSVAPPGPIDQPLRPMSDGRVAAFELLAGSGSGRASFTLARSKDRGDPPGDEATTVYNNTMSLSLSAPLSKDGDTSFATLDGLATGSKLEFGYTRFRGRVLTQAEDGRNPLLIEARRRCQDQSPAYPPGCTRLDQAFMQRFFTPAERDDYERGYARRTIQQSFAWSLRAALGYDEFDYYPLPSIGKATDRKLSWSVGGGVALFPFDRASASLDLDFQRSFEARKATTVCPIAVGGATTVTCVPGPLLGPELTEKLILAPELRYLHPISEYGLIRSVGFAPRVEVDLLARDLAFDLPIYFAADEKDGLTGGFRLGYLTEGKTFKFGMFVGKAFSLFE